MAKQPEGPPPLPPVNLVAAGASPIESRANLQIVQQAPGFPEAVILLADAITKRAEMVMLDYTAQSVTVRYQIDGVWHDLPARDRASGDAMLAVIKKLANLNHMERRARQQGTFEAGFHGYKFKCTITSQGVPTGERAALEITGYPKTLEKLTDLGMREKMRDTLKEMINSPPGLIVVSALPKDGLSTTWSAMLNAADRFMRDFVAIEDETKKSPEVINVEQVTYNASAGGTPATVLPKVLLKQPEVFVVPEIPDAKSMDALCDEVIDEKKLVYTSVRAREAVEALLRLLALKPSVKKFAQSITAVLNQRLMRRLCTTCKQAYQPHPQLLQKLGIPPGRVMTLYKQWEPPPTPPVDEKGRPLPPPICPSCNGIGYFGRMAVFELLIIDDNMRKALTSQPSLESLRAAARQSRHHSLQEEGILAVAQGVTSLAELQRAMKQ